MNSAYSNCSRTRIRLSPGQRHNAPCGTQLLRRLGRASRRPHLAMDRAYEDDETLRLAFEPGYRPVVLPRSIRHRPHAYDCNLDRRRNAVEPVFCRLKRFQRIASRCDKLDLICFTANHFVVIYDMLRSM